LTKSPFADWSNPKYIMQFEKSVPREIKVVLTTQKDKSALPNEETPFQHLPVCKKKGSQPLTQLTHSAHSSSAQVLKKAAVTSCRKKEEREAHCLVEDIL
jgi:hypothetical protein